MNRLRILRQEKKLSQKEIALLLEVNEKTISRWESGESSIKSDKAQALASLLGVSVGYLLGYSDENLSRKITSPFIPEDGLNFQKMRTDLKRPTRALEGKKFFSMITSQKQAEVLEKKIKEESERMNKHHSDKLLDFDFSEFKINNFYEALQLLDEEERELVALFTVLSESEKDSIKLLVQSLSEKHLLD